MTQGRVLILDDSQVVLDVTRLALEREGFVVQTLSSPFRFINVVKLFRPDIVLLDVDMPALHGERVIQVYEKSKLAEAPTILLYSSSSDEVLEKIVQRTGAAGYIRKTQKGILVRRLQAWMRLRQVRSDQMSQGRSIDIVAVNVPPHVLSNRIFGRQAMHVHTVVSAEQAQLAIRVRRPSLLIVSDTVPDTAATYFIRTIRKNPEIKNISILALLSRKSSMQEQMLRSSGANQVLCEPLHDDRLERVVKKLCHVAVRKGLRTVVKIQLEEQDTRMQIGYSQNLSATGMLIEPTSSFDVGDQIGVRFRLPSEVEEISALAEVVRSDNRDSQPLFGIHFLEIGEQDRQAIQRFVDEQVV